MLHNVSSITVEEKNLMTNKKKILNRLQGLSDIDGVRVFVTPKQNKVTIYYKTERSLDFIFKWANDHYIGYFEDKEGKQSHAVLALWEPIDAVHFASSYSLLASLRAGRPSPL